MRRALASSFSKSLWRRRMLPLYEGKAAVSDVRDHQTSRDFKVEGRDVEEEEKRGDW